MHRRVIAELLLFAAAHVAFVFGADKPVSSFGCRPVTVEDTIAMTQIGDQSYLDGFTRTGNVAYFSPDGTKFAFVTKKGDLKNDTVEYSLLVFKSDEVFSRPHAELVAKLASSSNREAITQLAWLPDNNSLVFIGEQPHEQPQLYRVKYSTRKMERLTDSPGAVQSYSFDAKGDSFVYEADVVPQPPIITEEMRRHGFNVTIERWDELYQDAPGHRPLPAGQVFYKAKTMKTAKPVGAPGYFWTSAFLHSPLKMSPDGRFVLSIVEVTSPPKEWNQYAVSGWSMANSLSCSKAAPALCSAQYHFIDLVHRVEKPLLDSPIPRGLMWRVQAAWTRDDSLLLVNAFLPLDTPDPAERARRIKNVYTVALTPGNHEITKISERATPYPANVIEADAKQDHFTVRPSNPIYGQPIVLRRQNGAWQISEQQPPEEARKQPLLVMLEQDINAPPTLVASDPKTGRKAVVLDLNPQFGDLTFGRVELFDWKTRDGRAAEGTLYYPPDHFAGKQYPLVIQTHGQTRERFWIDGPFTTAFAAQPLANRGFIVLQMGVGNRYDKSSLDAWTADWGTVREGPSSIAFLESAIDELDRRGLIDPQRVGLTGFSRTVYHTLYMLTHSDHHIAAAAVADGVHFSYADCVFYLEGSGNSECENENGGGPPYGPTLARWEKNSPAFNLDKIQAPLLLQAITAPLGEWEILAGLRWLKKPVEMLNFYPEGDHVLARPQQRLLSQGSVVDWYCFWLKGEEDPDPAKAEQYRRWRKLREEQQSNRPYAAK